MVKTLKGKVIKGRGYGRKIGFPTANLDRRHFLRTKQNIQYGIYAGFAFIEESETAHKAAIVIGPNDRSGLPKIEAHIIGLKQNLYKKNLSIELRKFIRPYKNFSTEKDLVEQIKKDIEKIKKYLS